MPVDPKVDIDTRTINVARALVSQYRNEELKSGPVCQRQGIRLSEIENASFDTYTRRLFRKWNGEKVFIFRQGKASEVAKGKPWALRTESHVQVR
jgi:hypothetical protein